jgi:hypothetical protein
MRTALVRGQVALGVPHPEAEDFARFVAGTLCAAQRSLVNEKATAATVAYDALEKRKSGYLDISTEVLETQEFPPVFPENSPLTAPSQRPNPQEMPLIPVFQNNPVEPVPA